MSTEFWIGVVLSVPIGIATGLATPYFQRRIEERGKRRAGAEFRRAVRQLREAFYFRAHPDAFTHYLVEVAIKTTFVAAIMAIVTGLIFAINQMMDALLLSGDFRVGRNVKAWEFIRASGWVVGQLVGVIGSIAVVNLCRPALSLVRRVKYFDHFIKLAPPDVMHEVNTNPWQPQPETALQLTD